MKRLLCLPLVLLTFAMSAQDWHFSQFYMAPLIVNPGLTGAFNGDIRAGLNYKSQWASVASPYKTFALSYDMALMKRKWEKSYLGAGAVIIRDVAGDANLSTTQANLSVASIIKVGEKQRVSLGIQGGFAQRSMSPEKQRWDNQYDLSQPGGYNQGIDSKESKNVFNEFYFGDFSGGLSWTYSLSESNLASNDQKSFNAGVAFHHINRPKQGFGNPEALVGKEGKDMYGRIVAHGGAFIGIQSFHSALLPSFIYMQQGPSKEANFGMLIRYGIKEESKVTGIFRETAILFGGYYRAGDAFIPSVMLEYANFALGVTYDINVSALKAASNAQGGIEISLRYLTPNPFGAQRGNVRFL